MVDSAGSLVERPESFENRNYALQDPPATMAGHLAMEACALPTTLLDLLSNSLLLRQTAPYLPTSALIALTRVSKGMRQILAYSPEATRYLDLSTIKVASLDTSPIDTGGISWRSERMDEALTEDEFYAGPLRGIMSKLSRHNLLGNVSTMILDGMTVPAEIIHDIISQDQYNVRILSIREVKHLNEHKLMQVLEYAVRDSRPAGTPKLRGLYVFGPKEKNEVPRDQEVGRKRSPTRYPDSSPMGVMSALGAQLGADWNRKSQEALSKDLCGVEDKWYQPSGNMFEKNKTIAAWAETLKACEGIIHFDAVLCRGPRHDALNYADRDPNTPINPHDTYLPPAVATIALGPNGCSKCHTSPEGPAIFGSSPPSHLPLLAPPPIHSSSIRAAQWPHTYDPSAATPNLFVRCRACLKHRWCERCGKWWDEACYMPSHKGHGSTLQQQQEFMQWQMLSSAATGEQNGQEGREAIKMGSKVECYGCGQTCSNCTELYIRACKRCRSEYCIVDNDGSSLEACDWCNYSGRRTRELY